MNHSLVVFIRFAKGTASSIWRLGQMEVPHYSRWGLYLQAAFVTFCWLAWELFQIAPGYSVAALAVVAVFMAVRAEHLTITERIIWVIISCLLFGAETRAIYWDRDQHDREQATERTEARSRFEEIARRIDGSLKENRKVLRQTTEISSVTKQSLLNITGGDSFAFMVPDTHVDALPLPMNIHNHGKYTLTGVNFKLIDVAVAATGNGLDLLNSPSKEVGILSPHGAKLVRDTGLYPRLRQSDGTDSILILIAAQNFTVEEILRVRRSREGWAFKYEIYGMNGKRLIKCGWSDDTKSPRRARDCS